MVAIALIWASALEQSSQVIKLGDRVNKNRLHLIVLMLFVLVASLAAWRQTPHTHASDAPATGQWSDFAKSMSKMHASMSSVEPSGDGDVDFVKLMLPHHQAAIDMAKAQLAYGKDPQMRRLAQEIVTDQQSEIELMQLWLKQHKPSSQQ